MSCPVGALVGLGLILIQVTLNYNCVQWPELTAKENYMMFSYHTKVWWHCQHTWDQKLTLLCVCVCPRGRRTMGTGSKEIHFPWRVENESKHSRLTIHYHYSKVTCRVGANSLWTAGLSLHCCSWMGPNLILCYVPGFGYIQNPCIKFCSFKALFVELNKGFNILPGWIQPTHSHINACVFFRGTPEVFGEQIQW